MSGKKKDDGMGLGAGAGQLDRALRLDMTNARVRAAMRILGISREDLQPVAQNSARTADGAPLSPAGQKRIDILERKRQDLVAEVEQTAESLHQEDADIILMPSLAESSAANNNRSIQEGVLEKEQQKLAALKKRTKEEVQRLVSDEVEKTQKHTEGARKNEESRLRLAQLRHEKKVELENQKMEQQKKEALKAEAVRQMTQRREEEARELTRKMQEKNNQVQQMLQDKARTFEGQKDAWRNKLDDINRRREQAAEDSRTSKIAQYRALMEKADIIQGRVDERIEMKRQKAEEGQAQFAMKVVELVRQQEEKAAERETAFRLSSDHQSRAREEAARLNSARSAAIKEAAAKKAEMVSKNQEVLENARKEKAKEVREKIKRDDAGHNRKKVMEEESMRRAEQRETMKDLFVANRRRQERSDEYAREQTLQKIRSNSDRVNNVLESRRDILEQRMQTLKESLIEKDHLHEMMNSMKSASPRKVNQVLKSLDMPPLDAGAGGGEKKEEK